MFFDNWADLGRILVVGTLAYAAVILFLRISGKRTLTQLNAFDLVVTVALGSILATILLSKDVTLAEGALALALLISLQFAISWLSVRSPRFRRVIKSEPTLLVRHGRFIEGAMRAQRLTEEEVRAALRATGIGELERIDAIVLETDGSISAISDTGAEPVSAGLPQVARPKE